LTLYCWGDSVLKAEGNRTRSLYRWHQKICSEFCWDTLTGRDYWRDLGIAGRIKSL
jgi:hypothetical protein